MIELGKKDAYIGKESKLQESVINYLRYEGYFAIHVPNGGSRNVVEAVNLKKQGVKSGCPDVLSFGSQLYHLPEMKYYNGIAIELKVKGGKLSDKQIEFIDQLEKSNWLCIVSFNLDSLMEYFKINIRI